MTTLLNTFGSLLPTLAHLPAQRSLRPGRSESMLLGQRMEDVEFTMEAWFDCLCEVLFEFEIRQFEIDIDNFLFLKLPETYRDRSQIKH